MAFHFGTKLVPVPPGGSGTFKIRKCVATKGLTDAFFVCVATKGLSGTKFGCVATKGLSGESAKSHGRMLKNRAESVIFSFWAPRRARRNRLSGVIFVCVAGKGLTGFLGLGEGLVGCQKAYRKRRAEHKSIIS